MREYYHVTSKEDKNCNHWPEFRNQSDVDNGNIMDVEESLPNHRFNELQNEFFETSKRLRVAQKPEDKLELLKELERIVKEPKRALTETDSRKTK